MEDISNWTVLLASTITSIVTILTAINKILDYKFKDFYDNQRLQLRYEICNFAGDLRNGIVKTRQEYEAIFEMYSRYQKIIDKFKFKNHYIESEFKYITKKFEELK